MSLSYIFSLSSLTQFNSMRTLSSAATTQPATAVPDLISPASTPPPPISSIPEIQRLFSALRRRDIWGCLEESSAYVRGTLVKVANRDNVVQYFTPHLSAIHLITRNKSCCDRIHGLYGKNDEGNDSGGKLEVEGNDEVRESDGGVEEGGGSEKVGEGGDKEVVRTDEKVTSEGKTDSDISVISSQLSPEEEDLGWDEIEDIGSGDEHKVSTDGSPNKADLRKRLSAAAAAADEEDLTWDIEDDDEPVKS